jgi:hypothetical protein
MQAFIHFARRYDDDDDDDERDHSKEEKLSLATTVKNR